MKKKRLYILIATVAFLLLWGYCGADHAGQDGPLKDDPGQSYLLDRPWVSALPEGPRQPFHVLFLAKQERAGAVVNGSIFQHLVTMIGYQVKGDTINVELLQAQKRLRLKYRAYKCRGPEGLDLCLDIGPRVKRLTLYSSTEWKRGRAGTPAFLDTATLPVGPSCETCSDADASSFPLFQ